MSDAHPTRDDRRSIDPDGLRDVARICTDRAGHLRSAAVRIEAEGRPASNAVLSSVARRIGETAARLDAWSVDLDCRLRWIDRVHTVSADAIGSVVTAIGTVAQGFEEWMPRRNDGHVDLADAYRRLDTILLENGRAPHLRARELQWLLTALEPAEVVALVGMLIGGGHDLRAVAELGAAAGSSWESVPFGLLDAFAPDLERGDPAASVFAGHALASFGSSRRRLLTDWLVASRGRVPAVLRGAAMYAGTNARTTANLEQIIELLTQADDVAQITHLVVELIAEQQQPHDAPWLDQLDRVIAALIDIDPRAIVAQLAVAGDRESASMVEWMERLIGTDEGPAILGRIVDGVIGPEHIDVAWFVAPGVGRTFPNAATAAYLAAGLSTAVRRGAASAGRSIGAMATVAALSEVVLPATSKVVKAVEVIVPVAMTIGVGAAAKAAESRIGDSMAALLERIDERFEPPAHASGVDLAPALHAFDERRDSLIRHWARQP